MSIDDEDDELMSVATVEPVAEDDDGLQRWADSEQCALLAFIAPYAVVRLNPVTEAAATIGVSEEFGIESFIEICNKARIRKLHLVINSPGGSVVSSYKAAVALRDQFKEIRVFVPHMAASGGTLLALTGNEIVMGVMSHLSPLDPQVAYQGTQVSANSFIRSFERFKKLYSKLQPEEAPFPLRCLTEKLDPVVIEEMSGCIATCIGYTSEILMGAGYSPEEAQKKAHLLSFGFNDHSTVLRREKLIANGFNVKHDSHFRQEWEQMRKWLRKYIGRSELVHHMRYCLPTKARASAAGKTKKRKTKDRARAQYPSRIAAALEKDGSHKNGKSQ